MSKQSFSKRFLVPPGATVDLNEFDTTYHGKLANKAAAQQQTLQLGERMRDLQYLLYAENRHSLLICLQAMDAGGKDGVIRHVFGYMNPQGCRVQSFKVPSATEAAHDFLWRAHRAAPATGEVAVFNRSHYEDVLVVRVHDMVPRAVWQQRYERINAFEQLLHDNGTQILKFFLHISPDEQLRRFRKRLQDPNRQWKISEADYTERVYWADYQRAYEEALSRCSTAHAPWYVIPADRKWYRNLAVSGVLVEHLERLEMRQPEPKVDLADIRCKYYQAKNSSS